MKKKIFCLLLAAVLAVFCCSPALAIVDPSSDFYVTDEANILSDETVGYYNSYNGSLEQLCDGAQFIVVTVNSLDGMYSNEYATAVMNSWSVGDSKANNGMVLVYCPSTAKGWLTQGYGITSDFTDSMCESYMDDYFWDYADAGEYDYAFQSILYHVLEWYEGHYGVTIIQHADGTATGDESYDQVVSSAPPAARAGFGEETLSFVVMIVIFLLAAWFVISMPFRMSYRRRYGMWPALFFLASRPPRRGWRGGLRGPAPGPHGPDPWDRDDFHRGGRGGPRGPGGGGFGGFGGGHGGGFGGFGGGSGGGGGFGGFGGGGFGGGMGHGGGGFGGGGGGGRR